MLDRVLGPGNSAVQVTADLNFDETTTQTTRYFSDPDATPLTDSVMTETYTTPDGTTAGDTGGVVGPDGELATTGTTDGGTTYNKEQRTSDNAVNSEIEQRQAAPGNVESLHVGVVLDTQALGAIDINEVQTLVASSLGIEEERGDTVEVTSMPFDRTAEEDATAALAAAEKADSRAEMMSLGKTGGLVVLVLLVLLIAWRQSKKGMKAREQATSYVVEQLRRSEPVAVAPVRASAGALDCRSVRPAPGRSRRDRCPGRAAARRGSPAPARLARGLGALT